MTKVARIFEEEKLQALAEAAKEKELALAKAEEDKNLALAKAEEDNRLVLERSRWFLRGRCRGFRCRTNSGQRPTDMPGRATERLRTPSSP